MKSMCAVCRIVGAILVIGGINWGLIAVFQVDAVARLLGPMTMASRIVYGLVGVSALLMLFSFFKTCPACQKSMKG